jgi:hypothetical protein
MSNKKKKDFNKNHPERLEDEVFITNADYNREPTLIGDGQISYESSWEAVGWKTKRAGSVAYDINGVPLGGRWPGAVPVFAKISEIKQREGGEDIVKRLLPD